MSSPAAAALPGRLSALCARTLWAARVGPKLHSRQLNVQAATEARKLKSIDDLPGPSLATTLYWLFIQGYADKSHLLQVGLDSGLIRINPVDLHCNCETAARTGNRQRKTPAKEEPGSPSQNYKKRQRKTPAKEEPGSPAKETGQEWYRVRSVLNPKMLKPQEVLTFAPIVNQVVGDLLRRVELLRRRSQDQTTVSDIAAELYKFGFEGISSILFETRLGCLQEEIPEDTLRFISAANNMLTLSETVVLFPRWSRRILPFWSRFIQAWDDLYDVARTLIDRRVTEIEAQVSSREQIEGMYLTYLLSSDRLSRAEVYICITELLLGGVDTTSNTLSWALYQLARDRGAQDRLYDEVTSVCPDRREPTTDDLSRMPYLKAVIKETLRLYPVVPGNGRLISETEVVVDNYWFPKKTQFHLCHYAASHDEAEFVDSELFVPERWLRAEPSGAVCGRETKAGCYQHHPYSFIPFGVGVRACVGKRVAEMEMYIALSRLMQHYEVQPEDGAPVVEPKTRTLLIPAKPINLRFLPRA
ncbi:sterol 26-hydroxylase, mitochondrial [Cheilinus undulatus]|uniref:sterol 26-hydroxylase, mitochondrial n=1 Tax=Cheilinus undulatus TaxID=241271 RepID=UPI001BD561D5|nr:sterol 26-hydroxylase, mitochondrial [Cheilinus undulatus]